MKTKVTRTVLGPEGMHPSAIHAALVVDRVWRRVTGKHPIVTGLAEEGHSEGSLHYGIPGDTRCRAFDIRAADLTPEERLEVDAELGRRLGANEFDLVWEALGTPNAHLHVEVDPR